MDAAVTSERDQDERESDWNSSKNTREDSYARKCVTWITRRKITVVNVSDEIAIRTLLNTIKKKVTPEEELL